MKRRVGLLALLSALSACAWLRERGLVHLSEQRLARAEELNAEDRAPLSFQHFTDAKRRAENEAKDSEAHAAYASVARLWLEAAIASAEASMLREQRLALERETVALEETMLKARRERLALEDQRERAAAAAIAREEAARALSRAAERPSLRVKLSADESRRAAQALLARAELVLLALPETVDREKRAELTAQLQKAGDALKTDPARALSLADQGLFEALSLLSVLRDPEAAPTAAQKASLAEAIKLAGATAERNEAGLLARLPKAGTERVVERLCKTAQAFPFGRVEVLAARPAEARIAARMLAQGGCTGERFQIGKSEHGTAALLFSGY